MFKRKFLILTILLGCSYLSIAQVDSKNFSFQVMAGHNDLSANSFAFIDGVFFIHDGADEDLTFVYGLGATWHPNPKLEISLNYEATNLFQSYLVYDEDGEMFAGEPLIKVISYNNQPRFFGLSANYELFTYQGFGFSLFLGADLLSTKLRDQEVVNFRDGTPKLSDAINASRSAFDASQFNLSYGARLSFKRYFLRVVFKDDLNRSITGDVDFEGNNYEFQNYWKMAFIQFGATVFRF